MTGRIFDLSRFRTDDGPGIRTAVFLKGCPLRCAWCHNPEGLGPDRELLYYPDLCAGCGRCAAACPQGCHTLVNRAHRLNRSGCLACGQCAAACPAQALLVTGREITPEAVVAEALRDQAYYAISGGGLTLTGGEPLFQPEFSLAVAKAAKAAGLSVCVETSGAGQWTALEALLPWCDRFLFDLKAPAVRYWELTGGDWEAIFANLWALSQAGAALEIRCPLIPGINLCQDFIRQIGEVAALPGVVAVTLEPYHPLGLSKSRALGRAPAYDRKELPDPAELRDFQAQVTAVCPCPVSIL